MLTGNWEGNGKVLLWDIFLFRGDSSLEVSYWGAELKTQVLELDWLGWSLSSTTCHLLCASGLVIEPQSLICKLE